MKLIDRCFIIWLDLFKNCHKSTNILNIIQSKFLIKACNNDLESAIEKMILVFDGFDKEQLAQEAKRFWHVHTANATEVAVVTCRQPEFIVNWDFNEPTSNLCLIL